MNNLVGLREIFNSDNIGLVIKIFQLILLVLFVLYSFLTIRQVGIMNHSLMTKIKFEIRVASYLQLFLGIGVFILILIR